MLLLFLTFTVLLLVRIPIGFCLIISSTLYLIFNPSIFSSIVIQRLVSGCNSFPLLALPLFMLAGRIMNQGAITDKIFNFADRLVGHRRGGIAYVNVLASMLFSGMSGSATADVGGLGIVEIKAMKERGYDIDFSVAVTAASSMTGPIIPPSIPLVIYGIYAGVSIGALFLAGFIPGALIGLSLMLMIYIISQRKKYPRGEPFSLKELLRSSIQGFPPLMTPVIIVGGILSGIFTPSESAAIAVLYALILGAFLYKQINLRDLLQIFKTTAIDVAAVMLIIAGASLFAWILAVEEVPLRASEYFLSLTHDPWFLLIFMNVILFGAGCLLEPTANMIIFIPVFLPIVRAVGIDPVHFGLVMTLNLMIGLLTPPVGVVSYVVCKVANISPERAFRAIFPFLVPLVLTLLIITFFPQIVLLLPKMLMR